MSKPRPRVPLTVVPPGTTVQLAELGSEIDALQREQLLAYGLALGQSVRLLQHQPMTVILADEVELALEAAVARQIWVDAP